MGISVNDSKLAELAQMIESWPGLVSAPVDELIDDSLVLADRIDGAAAVIDVGSGGGLPGLPLKLVLPDLRLTLLEADTRKASFLVQACARLRLRDVEVVNRRAESAGHDAQLREHFDVAVARALAALPVVVELCLPFVRVGGRLLAQKTQGEDMTSAGRAIDLLGGALDAVVDAPSRSRSKGTIVVIEKVRPTPPGYPRRSGVPARKPL